MEELSLRRTRHESRHRNAGFLQFLPKTLGQGADEGFSRSIHSLIGSRHGARNGGCEENAAAAPSHHVFDDVFGKVKRTGDVQSNHVQFLGEICLHEAAADANTCIDRRCVEWAPRRLNCRDKLMNALMRCEICLNGPYLNAKFALQFLCGGVDTIARRNNKEVEAILGELFS